MRGSGFYFPITVGEFSGGSNLYQAGACAVAKAYTIARCIQIL